MVAASGRVTGSIMRGAIFVLSFAATCFGAQASSIVALGGSAPAATPSIIALGEPETAVSNDKVAAIPKLSEPKSSGPAPTMVMRGGVVGGLSADPPPASVQPKPASIAAAPRQATSKAQAQSAGESAATAGAAPDTSTPVATNKPL